MQKAGDESVTDLQERVRVRGLRHVDVLGVRAEGAPGVGQRALPRALRRRVAELRAEAGLGKREGPARRIRTVARQTLVSRGHGRPGRRPCGAHLVVLRGEGVGQDFGKQVQEFTGDFLLLVGALGGQRLGDALVEVRLPVGNQFLVGGTQFT